MNILIDWTLATVAAYYVSRVLLYADVELYAGPLPQKNKTVVNVRAGTDDADFTYYEHRQPVTLFDYIRRVFGLYDIVKPADVPGAELWYIRQTRLKIWTCPTCLSFWVSIPLCLLLTGGAASPAGLLVQILATAGGSTILHALVSLMEEGMPSYTVVMPENVSVNDASEDGDYSSEYGE